MRVLPFPGDSNEDLGSSIATIGVFDGLHVGHRALLQQVVDRARAQNAKSIVITFDPHPQTVLGEIANPVKMLGGLPDRLALLASVGVDITLVCRFTRELSILTGEQFLRALQDRYGVRNYVLGPNHAFGYKRSGNRDTLPEIAKTLGLTLDWVAPSLFENRIVSSSWLRAMLQEGKLDEVNKLLCRPYNISGIVVAGEQRGRTLGFPTANVLPEPADKLIPVDGVYFAMTHADGIDPKPTLLSIGTRPTFGKLPRAIEAHIMNFTGDLYGRRIQLDLLRYWRAQTTFASAKELVACMKNDLAEADKFFNQL